MATTAGARFHLKSLFQQIENETLFSHEANKIYYDEVAPAMGRGLSTAIAKTYTFFAIVSLFFSFFLVLLRRFWNCTRSLVLLVFCFRLPFFRIIHLLLFRFGYMRSDNDLRVQVSKQSRLDTSTRQLSHCVCIGEKRNIAHQRPTFHSVFRLIVISCFVLFRFHFHMDVLFHIHFSLYLH